MRGRGWRSSERPQERDQTASLSRACTVQCAVLQGQRPLVAVLRRRGVHSGHPQQPASVDAIRSTGNATKQGILHREGLPRDAELVGSVNRFRESTIEHFLIFTADRPVPLQSRPAAGTVSCLLPMDWRSASRCHPRRDAQRAPPLPTCAVIPPQGAEYTHVRLTLCHDIWRPPPRAPPTVSRSSLGHRTRPRTAIPTPFAALIIHPAAPPLHCQPPRHSPAYPTCSIVTFQSAQRPSVTRHQPHCLPLRPLLHLSPTVPPCPLDRYLRQNVEPRRTGLQALTLTHKSLCLPSPTQYSRPYREK